MSRSSAVGRRTGDAKLPRKRTVVHLDHTSMEGGAEFALVRMLSAQPSWRPVVLLPPSSGAVFGSIDSITHGVRQPSGVSSGRPGVVLAGAVRLLVQSVLTRIHPLFREADIIDANTARSSAYGALAASTSGKPFVVHVRDVVDPSALGRFGYAVMTRIALPRADGVIANSTSTLASASHYIRAGALTEVIASASGLRLDRDRPTRAPAEPLRIGMLARIDPWKGQMLLLEAFAQALDGGDAILEFAGAPLFGHEDHLGELRERTVQLGLEQHVRFLGQVNDVVGLLDTWDIGVQFSTRPEPLGQNVLQYLAAGCAVVVADEGGPAEWIEEGVNGIRVAPRDVGALAGVIRRLTSDAPLRERIARAAATTPGLMDDAAVMRAHADFYENLLTSRPDHRPGSS